MTPNPKCPSCGHTMWQTRTVAARYPAADQHVFQCPLCELTYMTDDHTSVSGHPSLP
jgi:transposase-like protein